MPIYEYHCESCGETFEKMQKASDPPVSGCPKCGEKVKRVISQTSFSLKGSGWYKDGYSPSKGGDAQKPAATPTSTSDKKDGTK